ncbi:MAG: T9SS type A sorting domain-containing protein [Draconibacterium sp.]|nr:T9SS type A sorting domain-containing protein [Draconibacterium sp.]
MSFVFQNSVAVRYEAGTPGRAMSSQTWSAGMPTDFGSSGVSNYNFSVYCNYTSASSGLSKSGQYDNKITETIENPIGEANELKVYPNPFRQKLNFEFVSARNANAILEIYNLNGQLIAKLLDQQVQGGVMNRIEYVPNEIISGMYIYKLNLDGNISVGKVIYRK